MLPKGKVPGRKRLRKKKYDRPAAPPPSSASSQFSSSPRKLKLPSRSPSHSQKKLHRGGADNPDSNINSNSTRVQASLLATLSPASNDDPTSNDSSSPLSQPLHTEDALSALSKVIKTEVESWAEEVSSMQINKGLVQGEDEVTEARTYIMRLHNMHLSEGDYRTRFGVEALQEEFGEVQNYSPQSIVDAHKSSNEQIEAVQGSCNVLASTIRKMRQCLNEFNVDRNKATQQSLIVASEGARDVLNDAAKVRQQTRRSSDVTNSAALLSLGHVGSASSSAGNDARGRVKAPEVEDYLSFLDVDADEEGDESSASSDSGRNPSSPMVSPKQLIHTAKKENRIERQSARRTEIMRRLTTPRISAVKPRRTIPFHLLQDSTNNINWFKKLCGGISERVTMRTLGIICDLQREVLLDRKRKSVDEIKGNITRLRRQSLQLVQKVTQNNTSLDILNKDKDNLQKQLNISIRRCTAAQKRSETLLAEKRKDAQESKQKERKFIEEKVKVKELFSKSLEDLRLQYANVEERVNFDREKIDGIVRNVREVASKIKAGKTTEKQVIDMEAELTLLKGQLKEKGAECLRLVESFDEQKKQIEEMQKGTVSKEEKEAGQGGGAAT